MAADSAQGRAASSASMAVSERTVKDAEDRKSVGMASRGRSVKYAEDRPSVSMTVSERFVKCAEDQPSVGRTAVSLRTVEYVARDQPTVSRMAAYAGNAEIVEELGFVSMDVDGRSAEIAAGTQSADIIAYASDVQNVGSLRATRIERRKVN